MPLTAIEAPPPIAAPISTGIRACRTTSVRTALGATRRDVVRMVVKEGDSMTVLGTVLGVVALAATAVPAHRAASINPVSSLRGD